MDKETLSHYGWIVVLVLVLSVMIAMATPFGRYIATAIENTTEALFDTQKEALSAADIELMEQEFEDMFSDSSEITSPVKFGQPYQMTVDGMTMEYVFYADSSATIWYADAYGGYMPSGTVIYTETEVIIEGDPIKISADGTYLYDPEDETFRMTVKQVNPANVQAGKSYIADPNNFWGLGNMSMVFNSDGTATMYQDGVATVVLNVSNGENTITLTDGTTTIVCPLYPDGTKFVFISEGNEGYIFAIPCEHIFEGNYICSLCGFENNYRVSAASYMSLTGIDISSGDVVIPETFKSTDGKWYHVVGVASQGFQHCTNLTSIILPDSIKTIESYAFRHCRNLTSIFVPENVKTIGTEVFYGCTNLGSITVDENNLTFHSFENCIINTANKELIAGCKNSIIPTDGSVTSIRAFAFAYTSLTSIEIPNTVTVIKNKAFADCLWLTSVTIPDTVTAIDLMAFYNCTQLDTIKYTGTIEQWNKITFGADWYLDTLATEVICSDGTVSLS